MSLPFLKLDDEIIHKSMHIRHDDSFQQTNLFSPDRQYTQLKYFYAKFFGGKGNTLRLLYLYTRGKEIIKQDGILLDFIFLFPDERERERVKKNLDRVVL